MPHLDRQYFVRFSWGRAKRQLHAAIDLNSNYSSARILYASQLTMEGRFIEALREAELAQDLDPQEALRASI